MKVDEYLLTELISCVENSINHQLTTNETEELKRSFEITLGINLPGLNQDNFNSRLRYDN
jgi:hypothetical protein